MSHLLYSHGCICAELKSAENWFPLPRNVLNLYGFYSGGREDQQALSADWIHFSLPPREATTLTKKVPLLKFNLRKFRLHRNSGDTFFFCLSSCSKEGVAHSGASETFPACSYFLGSRSLDEAGM